MILTNIEVNVVEKGFVKIYCGEGKGKSTSSLGRALVCAGEGKEVFMIQFLKGRYTGTLDSVSYTHLTLPTTPYV